MNELLDVVRVEPNENFFLKLEFENGEVRVFDMNPLLMKKPFNSLQEKKIFECATVNHGTVVWPGDIDIAPETLYDFSRPLKPSEE